MELGIFLSLYVNINSKVSKALNVKAEIIKLLGCGNRGNLFFFSFSPIWLDQLANKKGQGIFLSTPL